jgi:hypothetical protein
LVEESDEEQQLVFPVGRELAGLEVLVVHRDSPQVGLPGFFDVILHREWTPHDAPSVLELGTLKRHQGNALRTLVKAAPSGTAPRTGVRPSTSRKDNRSSRSRTKEEMAIVSPDLVSFMISIDI